MAANFLLVRALFPGGEDRVKVPYIFKAAARGNVERSYSRGETLTGRFRTPVVYPPAPPGDAATGGEQAAERAPATGPEPAAERGQAVERAPATGSERAPAAGREPAPSTGIARRGAREATPRQITDFITTIPAFVDPGLEELLIANGTEISAEPIQDGNPWLQFLFSFAPALLLIGLYVWFYRRLSRQGGPAGMLGSMGKSGARRFDQDPSRRVTFDDVAGIDDAENELVEIVDFLKNPEKYTRLGARAPKGVLLVGPPGTGKTLLARAVAGEAGVPSSRWPARVRRDDRGRRRRAGGTSHPRERAGHHSIDEIDSIGRARSGGDRRRERAEQTLNQILHDGRLHGERGRDARATNQPDLLDRRCSAPAASIEIVNSLTGPAGRRSSAHTVAPLDQDVDLMSWRRRRRGSAARTSATW